MKTRILSEEHPQSNELSIAHVMNRNPHRNVARFFTGSRNDKGFDLLMKYYENGDLFQYQRSNKMSNQIVRNYFREIVHGVAHLHSLDIAHRDISLENVLLDKQFHCHLSGFSLAVKHAEDCDGKINKAFYTAPEVLQDPSKYNGFQSDIWSLGIVLLILLTGNVAFVHASASDMNFQKFLETGVRKHLASRRISVSEDFIVLLELLLQQDPTKRPSIQQLVKHRSLRAPVRTKKVPSSPPAKEKKRGLFRSIFRLKN